MAYWAEFYWPGWKLIFNGIISVPPGIRWCPIYDMSTRMYLLHTYFSVGQAFLVYQMYVCRKYLLLMYYLLCHINEICLFSVFIIESCYWDMILLYHRVWSFALDFLVRKKKKRESGNFKNVFVVLYLYTYPLWNSALLLWF